MSISERLSSLSGGSKEEATTPKKEESPDGSQLVQRCVIIQRDEKGYGLTVSGDNPVFVQSVKADGAAARVGVQQHDRIIKVNGTLVTSRNHIDVVKLIKSGTYVALTLLGKPSSAQSALSAPGPKHTSFKDTSGGRITAPQPVDPEKDRELWQQKVHTMQAMYEQAKEDYEKIQRLFLKNSSEKIHAQLIEKENTVKKLELQLKQIGGTEPLTPGPGPSPGHPSVSDPDHMESTPTSWQQQQQQQQQQPRAGYQRSAIRHQKQASAPVMLYKTGENKDAPRFSQVSRSKSDVTARRLVSLSSSHSSHISGFSRGRESYLEAASVPLNCSDGGSVSDSPHTSPSISPTPIHPSNCHTDEGNNLGRVDSGIEDGVIPASQQNIITIDDEDFNSEEEQSGDQGPFASFALLEKKPAHLAIFLHYLISNSDPSSLFFYVVSDLYSHAQGSVKDLRKWAYEIHSTFLVEKAPLKVEVDASIVNTVDCILTQTANENSLRSLFDQAKGSVKTEIAELLADFCTKKDLGLGSIYGVHELEDVMEKSKEQKLIDKYLSPHLERCTKDNTLSDRDQAIGWALASFFKYVGLTKNQFLERAQSFVMKDKRVIRLPGKSNKPKQYKGHNLNQTHYMATTFCSLCGGLIWGVGTQGFQCQVCEINIHRQCIEELEPCAGKHKKGERDKDKKRASAVIPVMPFAGRKQSNPNKDAGTTSSTVQEALRDAADDQKHELHIVTQPIKKEEDPDLTGITAGHGVKSIIQRYEDGPTSPVDGADPTADQNQGKDRELGRSESMKGRGEKSDRPARRAKSDVDMDEHAIKALNQSGSSSTSSLSNRSVESPSASSETVNDMIAADSDLDVEAELPSLKSILGDDAIKKLKPKEKKRQEVLNELFYTERAHVRCLKIIDMLFKRPMMSETGTQQELARALFPNLEQMVELHREMNNDMRKRRKENPVVQGVGDILLSRFSDEGGEIYRQACAEYCRNQSHALEALKKHQRKEQRLSQFLNEAESSPLCRRLQLKDLLPVQMQRLTKYPLLIDNLMKYTHANSEEHNRLERARERSKQILAYVNQAVKDCENFHRLRNLQKRLDKKPIENLSNHHSYEEMKQLDLTMHKLVYDGILSMKLRTHRMMEVHVVLLEDIMVLLQKQDDKLVLCQANAGSSRGDDKEKYINTHSPLLKLQNLLARNVATDKKAFFVVNTENSGPQIYEFVAPTQDERKKWMKYINDSVEDVKGKDNMKPDRFIPPAPPVVPPPPLHPEPETISLRRDQIRRPATPPHEPSRPAMQIDSDTADVTQTADATLIQPEEVHISDPVMGQAEQVLTPVEKLRRNDETLELALEEREKIFAEIHGMHLNETQEVNEVDSQTADLEESPHNLVMTAQKLSCRLTQLVISCSRSTGPAASPADPQSSSSTSPPAKAQPSKVTIPIPMEQLRDMAIRMNQILQKLLAAVSNQDEQQDSLREELRQAQQKLNSLRDIQRAVMGGAFPQSPHSRPSSMVSLGSYTAESGAPSVHEVADSLREQAQEMLNAVGLSEKDVDGQKTPTATTPPKLASVSSYSSEPEPQPAAKEKPDDDTSSSDHEDIMETLPPLPEKVEAHTATITQVNSEMSKVNIISADEELVETTAISSIISSEMMSSTLTTDLDEGANDSDNETTPQSVIPDLGDLGETDTDSIQNLEGVVLPGGISSEELVNTSDSADKENTETTAASEQTDDPIEI